MADVTVTFHSEQEVALARSLLRTLAAIAESAAERVIPTSGEGGTVEFTESQAGVLRYALIRSVDCRGRVDERARRLEERIFDAMITSGINSEGI